MTARAIGPDTAEIIGQDRADADVLARIARDVASGERRGVVRGTPTLFIDGVLYQGGYDAAAFIAALAR